MSNTNIPRPIISIVSEVISSCYSHSELDNFFFRADAPGDPPNGSRLVKCQEWLNRCNSDNSVDPLKVLGGVLEDFMERECSVGNWKVQRDAERNKIRVFLGRHGLSYVKGGHIHAIGVSGAIRSLDEMLQNKDLEAIDKEFNRALENIEVDPPASLTAACAIIESLCKLYIAESNGRLTIPRDASVKPLWTTVAKDIGFDPSKIEDDDLKRILTGLSSIVDGVGALRTHAGSAHGHPSLRYKIQPRHARLAVHSAHTLVIFLLETWEHKKSSLETC